MLGGEKGRQKRNGESNDGKRPGRRGAAGEQEE